MVAERLPVRRDGREVRAHRGSTRGQDPLHPEAGVAHQRAERHVVRQGAVVGYQRDRPPAAGPIPPGHPVGRRPAHLVRRQNCEGDPLFGQDVQGLVVHRRLGEPHPGGLPAEPASEIGDAPAHLGRFVAPRSERHDDVVVRHRDRVAVPEPFHAGAVGGENALIGSRGVPLHPVQQRRPDVEADPLEGVDDPADRPVAVHQPRRQDRPVALVVDPLVPVVPGRGVRLALDLIEPRPFARWLVEVPVDHRRALRARPRHGAIGPVRASAVRREGIRSGKTSLVASSVPSTESIAGPRSPVSRAPTSRSRLSRCSVNRLVA